MMGEFVGVVRWDGASIDQAITDRLVRGLPGQQPARLWRDGAVAIGERPALRRTAPQAPQLLELPSGAVLVADVRLDDRGDTLRALGVDPADRADDMALLGMACERWGAQAAEKLSGNFAFAHWDERQRRLTLARDALGIRTLYYWHDGGTTVFATTLRAMLALPMVPRDLDDLAIGNYMGFLRGDVERTFYRHIRRVPPGGVVVIAGGSVRVERYWTPAAIADVRYARDDDYVQAGRELLDRAVANRLPAQGDIASMLSGGLDSNAVVGTAARLLGDRRLAVYTRIPGAAHPYDTFDEAAHAGRQVARHDNLDWTVIDDDFQSIRDLEPELDAPMLGQPRIGGFNSSWFRPLLDAVERSGAAVLLDGGLGNMTLSWAGAPPYAQHLRRGRLIAAARAVMDGARVQQTSLGTLLRTEILPAIEPRRLRLWRWKRRDRGLHPLLRSSAVRPEFLDRLDFHRHAEQYDQELPFEIAGDVRTWRMYSIHNQNPRDILGAVRHQFSFDQRDPMTDRRLAEFSLGVPNDQFVRNGERRWLARRIIADRAPPVVVNERRVGWQCPEWHHIAAKRHAAVAASLDRLARSPLASDIVDVPRLRHLLDTFPDDATSAMASRAQHGAVLQRGVLIGSFLRWHEGGNG